jgi:hypothetical protein
VIGVHPSTRWPPRPRQNSRRTTNGSEWQRHGVELGAPNYASGSRTGLRPSGSPPTRPCCNRTRPARAARVARVLPRQQPGGLIAPQRRGVSLESPKLLKGAAQGGGSPPRAAAPPHSLRAQPPAPILQALPGSASQHRLPAPPSRAPSVLPPLPNPRGGAAARGQGAAWARASSRAAAGWACASAPAPPALATRGHGREGGAVRARPARQRAVPPTRAASHPPATPTTLSHAGVSNTAQPT